MGKLTEYASISAKSKAMARRLLTEENYSQILSKSSVREVAEYLKTNTHYETLFKDVKQHDIHRGELEALLYHSLADERARLIRFCSGNKKRFLTVFITGYEIEAIKIAIRTIDNEIKPKLYPSDYFAKHMTVNIERLFEADSFNDIIDRLKGTPYYKVLYPFLKEADYRNLFNIEMALDVYYYKYSWGLKDKLLSSHDKAQISDTLGSEIDLLNLMFVIRSKRYYNTSKEYMYAFLLPIHYKISTQQMKEILEASTLEESMRLISQTPYKDVFITEDGHYIEENYLRYNFNKHYRRFRKDPFSIGALVGYMHVNEIEIRNLIMIIEGIRYSQDKAVIEKYLVKR